ncbi:MAG: glycosyltransferase family A protein [Elusimicrobia bacterium]|nr:glycosyltransferase family A protein [Elusimicrobiota bacterium]
MAEDKPLVSAVINNHNYARFLGQAVESVLGQTYPKERVELVVVDDGSTDGSRRVIESFSARVKPVYQERGGQAAAINAGVAAASGELVCLLDSDDWWRPDKLERVAERFRAEPGLGAVQHWCQEVGPDLRPLPGRLPQAPAVLRLEDFLAGPALFTGTTGLCFRRDILRQVGPIPAGLTFCADEYLYTHALFFAPLGTVAEPLAWRRVHGANLYAGLYRDPVRLAEHLRVRALLDAELDRRLRERGAAFAERELRRRRAEVLQEELFLSRYRGDLSGAWRSWNALGRSLGGGYRLFKQASLLLALASPALYLAGFGLYARCQGLVSARRRLLKD